HLIVEQRSHKGQSNATKPDRESTMVRRILIPGAGTGAANNLVRSLKSGSSAVLVIGSHSDRFSLCRSTADKNYPLPKLTDERFPEALEQLIRKEAVDLIFPNTDADVDIVSRLRRNLSCHVFLPQEEHPVDDLDGVDEAWAKFDRPT